jgi:hypothetical protein
MIATENFILSLFDGAMAFLAAFRDPTHIPEFQGH